MIIGRTVHWFGTVTSTNDIARRLAGDGAEEGTTVVADEQMKGRGSRGRVWLSPLGANLLVSVILRPDISGERRGEIALVAAAAAARAIRCFCGLDARIKWPNDILVGKKKLAGMIVEAAGDAAILGIGINVNWTDLPDEIARTATSIALELGRTVERDELLTSFLAELDALYGIYCEHGFGKVLGEWRSLEVTTGTDVTVESAGETIRGRAVEVDDNGCLVVLSDTGERRVISSGIVVGSERRT